jgi:hypothetical protein
VRGLRFALGIPIAVKKLSTVRLIAATLLHILVTVTPRLEGRSFGTNVMEATRLALMDKPQSDVTDKDFGDLIERIPLLPNIEVLNP